MADYTLLHGDCLEVMAGPAGEPSGQELPANDGARAKEGCDT